MAAASLAYPQRSDRPAEGALDLPRWLAHHAERLGRRALAPLRQALQAKRRRQTALAVEVALQAALPAAMQAAPSGAGLDDQGLAALRIALRQPGGLAAGRVRVLTLVAATGEQVLGLRPYLSQLLAACALLDGELAEMATGEGKTYAAALAAAAAALGGVPVHVMTANDYLVQRDAKAFAPLFEALGLSVGFVQAGSTPAERRAAYACDLTYCTAREAAFDYLRDASGGQAFQGELQRRAALLGSHTPGGAGEAPVLRGLWRAIVDEADGLLADEAAMPLLLSAALPAAPGDTAAQRALGFQSLAMARHLRPGEDYALQDDPRQVRLAAGGEQRLEALAAPLGGPWLNRRHRRDSVLLALQALHLLQRDRDYVVRDGQVLLLDPVTGRTAEGRRWTRGLHALVELKEGCALSPPTTVAARISLQRFFGRYLGLAGMSGTLRECGADLQRSYGCRVVRIPLRRPDARCRLPDRLFATEEARCRAAVQRVQALHARGQPVLLGTDSVQASEALSRALAEAGVPHQRLDAQHDAQEARVVAQAGQRGAVTVATHMAGRGTDILLGPGVAELGGLHVLSCQDNPSARLDRQLIGRCARTGLPGSAEVWRWLDAPAWAPGTGLPGWLDRRCREAAVRRLERCADAAHGLPLPPGAQRWFHWRQARHEADQALLRRQLAEQDLDWLHRAGISASDA